MLIEQIEALRDEISGERHSRENIQKELSNVESQKRFLDEQYIKLVCELSLVRAELQKQKSQNHQSSSANEKQTEVLKRNVLVNKTGNNASVMIMINQFW